MELHHHRVLVVEDDADCRDAVTNLLESEGYAVTGAEDGQVALDRLREGLDPCVILLDLMMPDMDGFAVCQALRASGKRIPVILLTARDDTDTRLEGMNLGVSEFLTKPINRVELLARVRAQLHILALGRQLEAVEANLQARGQRRGTAPRG